MLFRYDPPASYYEPVEEPELECRVSDDEIIIEVIYKDGYVDGGEWFDIEDAKDYYAEIKECEEHEEIEEIRVYEVLEYYGYNRYWQEEELVEKEGGEIIYTEKF